MGCDIHMYVEVKQKDGTWKKVGKVFKNPYYNPERKSEIDEDGYEWNPEFKDQPYLHRNYDLFAILADVRNGRGFAGCDTGDRFNSISSPKGLPEDVSAEVKVISDDWDIDGHSHSYFTVKELENFDWNQVVKKRGMVNKIEYKKYMEKGQPESWSEAVMGPSVNNIKEKEMKALVIKENPELLKRTILY